MAGVYIKGMEMPKVRDTLVLVKTNGTAIVYEDEAYVTTAIPVPDHGDLIDRDRAVHELVFDYAYAAADLVKKLPTIIQADKEGEA